MQPQDELLQDLNVSTSDQMAEQVAFVLWSAVASTTKAFGKIGINIDPKTQRVFVKIKLRWFGKIKKLEPMRRYWLAKAERKAKPFIPTGWNSLFYYDKE